MSWDSHTIQLSDWLMRSFNAICKKSFQNLLAQAGSTLFLRLRKFPTIKACSALKTHHTMSSFDLTSFHESLDKHFHQSVSDYAETETHWCSQCSNFDEHLEMSSVYKDGQNEAFSEAVSKQTNHFDIETK